MTDVNLWRFLIVDDKQADNIEQIVAGNNILEAPNQVVVEKCSKFSDAIDKLNQLRIDLIILDLKEEKPGIIALEEDEEPLAGEKVFEQIRRTRFIPVVFYTAYAHKIKEESPYARIVRRGNPRKLRTVIKQVFETGLPQLIRHLEIEQKKYMWDHVKSYWGANLSTYEKTDAAFLLARRLGNVLKRNAVEDFLMNQNLITPKEDDSIYPIEMYVYPSVNPKLQVGDILKSRYNTKSNYWMVMTPSCDLEQDKVMDVVLAACFLLSKQPEYKKVKDYLDQEQTPSSTAKKDLETLIGNNRNAEHGGKRFQPERYSFLPGTFFLPDLVVDFQALLQVPLQKIKPNHRIASLDVPFAEACSSRFARYYGRLGTPDLNKKFVSDKILEMLRDEIV